MSGGPGRGGCVLEKPCSGYDCDGNGKAGSAVDSPPGTTGVVCDRFTAGGKAGGGKRGHESSDASEAVVALVEDLGVALLKALATRRKLVELRLLPRDWVSTRPSALTRKMELEGCWWA